MNEKTDKVETKGAAKQPAQGEAGQPAQPEAGQPAQPETGQPAQPETGQPAQPETGQPAQPETGQPAQGEAGRPAQGETGQPAQGETGQPKQHEAGQPAKSPPGKSRLPALLLTVLIVVAAAAGYLAVKIKQGQGSSVIAIQSLSARLEALEDAGASLSRENELLSARLAETNQQVAGLMDGFSSLYQQTNRDAGWQLMEIKYLLMTASYRLVLERDVSTALAALRIVDTKLRAIPDPNLIPLREQLVADMNRLKATAAPDFTGLALLLSDLAGRVEQFPLKTGKTNPATTAPVEVEGPATETGWQRLSRVIWRELKTLVVISRSDKKAAVLLPEEQYFLYQNLRLQLESARLAVLLKDGDHFQESVNTCKDWLHDHFDTSDNRVRAALASLTDLAAIDLDETIPSIDRSLQALENYLARQAGAMINDEAQR